MCFSVKKQQTYKNKRKNRRDNAEFRAKKPILREFCRKIKQSPKAKRAKKKDKAQKGEIEKTPYTWEKHKQNERQKRRKKGREKQPIKLRANGRGIDIFLAKGKKAQKRIGYGVAALICHAFDDTRLKAFERAFIFKPLHAKPLPKKL